jgi:hypothetical protein
MMEGFKRRANGIRIANGDYERILIAEWSMSHSLGGFVCASKTIV